MGEPFKRVTLVESQSMSAEILGRALDRRGYRCGIVVADPDSTPTSLLREVGRSRPELVVASVDLWSGPADRAEVYRSLSRGGQRVVAVIDVDTAYRRGEALSRAVRSRPRRHRYKSSSRSSARRCTACRRLTGLNGSDWSVFTIADKVTAPRSVPDLRT
ncbi:MAG TPA: hypothetical protein VI452_13410 [Marmoricola sp.]